MKTKTSWLCVALILFLPFSSMAEDVLIRGLSKGTHYLRVEVKEDGTATHTPLTVSKGVTSPTPTDPTDGGDTGVPADPTSSTAKEVRKATTVAVKDVNDPKYDPDTAIARSQVYKTISEQLSSGSLEVGDAPRALKLALGFISVRVRPKDKAAWKAVDKVIEDQLVKLAQDGKFVGKEAEAYMQIAVGLNVDQAIAAVNIIEILTLVKAVIEFLREIGILKK